MQGTHQGFVLYRQRRQCNEKITDLGGGGGGKLLWFYQLNGGYSRGLKNEKSKSRILRAGGGGGERGRGYND